MAHFIPLELLEKDAVATILKTGATVDSAVGAAAIQLSLAISAKRHADSYERLVEMAEKDREPVLSMAEPSPTLFEQQRAKLVECSERDAVALERIAQALWGDELHSGILYLLGEMSNRPRG